MWMRSFAHLGLALALPLSIAAATNIIDLATGKADAETAQQSHSQKPAPQVAVSSIRVVIRPLDLRSLGAGQFGDNEH